MSPTLTCNWTTTWAKLRLQILREASQGPSVTYDAQKLTYTLDGAELCGYKTIRYFGWGQISKAWGQISKALPANLSSRQRQVSTVFYTRLGKIRCIIVNRAIQRHPIGTPVIPSPPTKLMGHTTVVPTLGNHPITVASSLCWPWPRLPNLAVSAWSHHYLSSSDS